MAQVPNYKVPTTKYLGSTQITKNPGTNKELYQHLLGFIVCIHLGKRKKRYVENENSFRINLEDDWITFKKGTSPVYQDIP